MRRLLIVSALALTAAAPVAAEDTSFSSNDVVNFLVDSVDLG